MKEPDKVKFAKSVLGIMRLMSACEQLELTASKLKSIKRQLRTLDKPARATDLFGVAITTIDETVNSIKTCADTINLAVEFLTPLTPPEPEPEETPICDAEQPL